MDLTAVERDAWLALEEGRLDDADRLWTALIGAAADQEQRDRYLGQHAYVFVARERFDEARAIYRDLFERSASHRHLHQLGMVEREAGNREKALAIFEREAGLLPAGDALALGANLYERALLRGNVALMEQCVAAAHRSGDPTMLGVAYRLRGDLLADRDAYRKARGYFEQAGDTFGVAEIDRKLASA